MANSSGAGKASTPAVIVVNHAEPTDQRKLHGLRMKQADAAVAAAEAAVDRATEHLEEAPKEKKTRQRAHLKGAKDALAQATAARKELEG
jgi:hypothetical protein